jgi:hypothetical protein
MPTERPGRSPALRKPFVRRAPTSTTRRIVGTSLALACLLVPGCTAGDRAAPTVTPAEVPTDGPDDPTRPRRPRTAADRRGSPAALLRSRDGAERPLVHGPANGDRHLRQRNDPLGDPDRPPGRARRGSLRGDRREPRRRQHAGRGDPARGVLVGRLAAPLGDHPRRRHRLRDGPARALQRPDQRVRGSSSVPTRCTSTSRSASSGGGRRPGATTGGASGSSGEGRPTRNWSRPPRA